MVIFEQTYLKYVLIRVAIAVMKHHGQNNLGKKRVIWLMLPYLSINGGSRAEIQTWQKPDVEVMEELFIDLLFMAYSARFFIPFRTARPWGPTYNGLGHSIIIIN